MYKNFFLPVGLLAGTIIGAGMFSLPYVFSEAGLSLGFAILALGAVTYTIAHLMYAEIILATPGEHRFVGYAGIHLGAPAYLPAFFASVIEMILVLIIYLSLSASFSQILFGADNAAPSLLIFWALGSLGIFLNLKRLVTLESFITWGMVAIVVIIFYLGLQKFSAVMAQNLPADFGNILIPLAPAIFALSGRVAIPSLIRYFKGERVKIRRAIIWGTVLPAIVYGLFVLGVIALSPNVTGDAIGGLYGYVSREVLGAIGALGLLSIFSSYIVVGLDVKNILQYDLKFSAISRGLAVVATPIALYLAGLNVFEELVAVTGGIFLSLEGLFLTAMWMKVQKVSFSPRAYFTGAVFAAALVYEIIKIIK